MKLKKRDRLVVQAILLVLVAAGCWFGISSYLQAVRCREAKAAFVARVEKVTHDAHSQLSLGTKREDVVRFFAANGIPLQFDSMGDHQEAAGTLHVAALPECTRNGCMLGSAEIRVRVAVDNAGTVINLPFVFATGLNCL